MGTGTGSGRGGHATLSPAARFSLDFSGNNNSAAIRTQGTF